MAHLEYSQPFSHPRSRCLVISNHIHPAFPRSCLSGMGQISFSLVQNCFPARAEGSLTDSTLLSSIASSWETQPHKSVSALGRHWELQMLHEESSPGQGACADGPWNTTRNESSPSTEWPGWSWSWQP